MQRVAIVGAGVGGLSAAIDLAVMGVEVTVFERGIAPGGKMSGDLIGDVRLDGGPTVLTFRDVFEEMFANAGANLSDYVTLAPLDILARHAWSATEQFDLCADVRRSSENVGRLSGAGEARRFLEFCERAKQIFQTLDRSFMRAERPSPLGLVTAGGMAGLPRLLQISPFATLWRELGRYFRDPRLRQLFGRYATYCGSSPFHAPATLMLVAHAEQNGVWTVEGGMYRLAQALASLAERNGAKIRYQSGVRSIDVRQGKVRGVTLEDDGWLLFDRVIFNGDAAAIADGHLGADAAHAVPQIDRRHRSLSAVTWTALADTSGFALARHNVFFSRDYRAEFDDIFLLGKPPSEPTVYVCAQDRDDGGLRVPGVERLLILTNAPPNGDCNDAWELEPCQEATFRQLERCGLKVKIAGAATKTRNTSGFRLGISGDGRSALRPGVARLDGVVPASGSAQPDRGPLSGGRQHASGTRSTDGSAVGAARSAGLDAGSRFDQPVPENGYAWWYVDALSDDGRYGLTVIVLIGSVFSPYYAHARRRGRADPLNHCAFNVALYGPHGKRWAMTERGRSTLSRSASHLEIGRSAMSFDGDTLSLSIDEIGVPIPLRLRGRIRLYPRALAAKTYWIDGDARHLWRPIAPSARVEVEMNDPALRWSGHGYFDHNRGSAPIENDFSRWTWSRAKLSSGSAIFYDTTPRRNQSVSLALRFGAAGVAAPIDPPPFVPLRPTGWRIARAVRSENSGETTLRTLEDTPFYARSVMRAQLCGEVATGMHESLSLDRFSSKWVQCILPFRMPRRA